MMRIALFLLTNLAVMVVFGLVLSLTGIQSSSMTGLLIMALLFGFGGSIVSLMMSKWMALKSVGGEVIEQPRNETERWLMNTVAQQAQQVGIAMPQVAIYHAPDINAFATGARRDASLVAVSTGLLQNMSRDEAEAVIAHEISHIANGDMVTMTLIQGVVNTFVIFISRVIAQIADPSIWAGLLTLIVLEIVLGIDNLVFIAILADKLPPKQRDKARLIGLSLALVMRLGLLSVISWMVTLTKPLITIADFSFSGRDLIMLLGGIFLLFKATTELHERLENRQHDAGHGKGYASFWVVVLQIVVLDAVFSLDAVITAVGMVNHLPVMMAAVVIAMILMLLASKPLTRFVNQHPTVVVLCLSFLLMIGLSLVAEGFGFHIPKGYLYAAIGFSIIIEFFNQVARRNFVRHQSTLPLRARTADAILRLMGGRKQASVSHDADSPAAVPVPEGAFAEEERYMINGVLTLAQRSLRSIMTPRGEISWVDAEQSEDEIRRQLLSSPHSLFPVCRGELDEIIGIVRAKEMLVALESGENVAALASASPAIVVPETLDPINLLGVLRRARGSFVIVTNEFGVVQGLVTPLDVLEAIAGEFPDADETPEIVIDGDGWLIKGSTDLHALQQALGLDPLINDDEDIATVAGLVISANGHIPRIGDVVSLPPLHFTVVEANDYRVDLVRAVVTRPPSDEEE
ncbi:TPA: protease HtpX [Klebsiella pneumoniae]|nr:protease HtpX [Klebsiella pneumoniae]HBR0739731.1 protease HtpX [Klebsiella pneumoniae]